MTPPQTDSGFWQRLLHRWFVEFNPLYLLSAAFVLVGVSLSSRALAQSGSGAIAITGVAELYAWSLIASAAFLVRLGLGRPAVMLALLTALYQCDPTLHTETCAYLGVTGAVAGAGWLASFVAKLYAVGWALRLQLSASAVLVPAFGAVGVVILPRLLSRLDPATVSPLVILWLFALFAAALWTSRDVHSRVGLDAWGETVLRRTTGAVWATWALLALAHVCFWAEELQLRLTGIVPAVMLLATRWVRRELGVWAVVAATLLIASRLPGLFPTVALMAAISLALRALRTPTAVTAHPEPAEPYRSAPSRPRAEPSVSFQAAPPPARTRLLSGSLYGVYLALWTWSWPGGTLPEHRVLLDAALALALLLLAWKTRSWSAAIPPLTVTYGHLALRAGLIPVPATALHWGLTCVALGFALLAASLAVSFRLRRGPPA